MSNPILDKQIANLQTQITGEEEDYKTSVRNNSSYNVLRTMRLHIRQLTGELNNLLAAIATK